MTSYHIRRINPLLFYYHLSCIKRLANARIRLVHEVDSICTGSEAHGEKRHTVIICHMRSSMRDFSMVW